MVIGFGLCFSWVVGVGVKHREWGSLASLREV